MSTALPAYLSYANPLWPEHYAQIARLIASLDLTVPHSIEHVGSTSILGMVAKPIIDVDLITRADRMTDLYAVLSIAGWEHSGDGGLAGRECFCVRTGSAASACPHHHLYLCPASSRELVKHLLFRDYLRAHPPRAQWLSQKKIWLGIDQRLDRDGYLAGKEPFMATIMSEAHAWATGTRHL